MLEQNLWDGVRALDEAVMLLNQLDEKFAAAGNTRRAAMTDELTADELLAGGSLQGSR